MTPALEAQRKQHLRDTDKFISMGIRKCEQIAEELTQTHARAFERAVKANNEDAATFIAGLRDGAAGVRDRIRALIEELVR